MPISPKVFYSHSTRSRLCRFASSLAFSVLYLTVGLLGFLFGSITISRPLFSSSGCIAFKTRSISVVWEKVTGGSEFESGSYSGVVVKERHKVMGFVGIQAGFAFTGRRRSLRKTWFPSDREGLTRLAFFKAAYALFDSDFYVKTDDDIYLRPDRLSLLLAKERFRPQTYIGCMKKGPVFTDPKLKCLVGVIWMSIST